MKPRKRPPLWVYGLICIGAGAFASHVASPSLSGPLTDEQRGQLEGAGFAGLLFFVVGLALIVVSVVKRIRSQRGKPPPK